MPMAMQDLTVDSLRLLVLVDLPPSGEPPLARVRAAVRGGATLIQVRGKKVRSGDLLDAAVLLHEHCRKQGVPVFVNDRPDVALLSDADGVHLGQTDMSLSDARRIVGPDRLIGVSTHDVNQLSAAIAQGPDYIAVGPMFPTTTKPQERIAGPTLLSQAVRETDIAIVPIGGITPDNAVTIRQAGARCVCVCSAVIGVDRVAAAAARLT